MQLTYATLAAFTKYPRESLSSDLIQKYQKDNLEDKLNNISSKKHGFFQSEKDIFKEVAEKVGLIEIINDENVSIWYRHPLAFLVEAADDICYRIADIEDGYNMGLISYTIASDLLIKLAGEEYRHLQKNETDISIDLKGNIRLLRSKAIGTLMKIASKSFEDNEEKILTGSFHKNLLDEDDRVSDILGSIKEIKEKVRSHVYNSSEILLLEIAGFDVISGLLNDYIYAINNCSIDDIKGKYSKILKILPGANKFGSIEQNTFCTQQYLKNLQVTDYISGMTDSYAVSLFKQLKGISLPTNI